MYDYFTLKQMAVTEPETCICYLLRIENSIPDKDFDEILNIAVANLD